MRPLTVATEPAPSRVPPHRKRNWRPPEAGGGGGEAVRGARSLPDGRGFPVRRPQRRQAGRGGRAGPAGSLRACGRALGPCWNRHPRASRWRARWPRSPGPERWWGGRGGPACSRTGQTVRRGRVLTTFNENNSLGPPGEGSSGLLLSGHAESGGFVR